MSGCIAFDLEGPLSPHDSARDMMRLFPNGDRVFEVVSRYDVLVRPTEGPDHEPGDVLGLIVPFLMLHGVREADVARLAAEATFVAGAPDFISWLSTDGWRVFCITTICEQFALHLTHKLGIFAHNVACTPFPLDRMSLALTTEDSILVGRAEEALLALDLSDDTGIRQTLGKFFGEDLARTEVGKVVRQVKPVGGRRKAEALTRFANKHGAPLSGWAVVGGSIADCSMLTEVYKEGGLAVAFNADRHALSCATMGFASTHLSDLKEVLMAWKRGGQRQARQVVQERQRRSVAGERASLQWLAGRDLAGLDEVVQMHERLRQTVRQSNGKSA